MLVLMPGVAMAQTSSDDPRWSVRAGGGPTVIGGGYNVSGTFGFSPTRHLDLLVSFERIDMPFEREVFSDGVSMTRGGEFTFVTGELRASLFPNDRVTPYVFVGAGGGMSRPTVNEFFTNRLDNQARTFFIGGGVEVPLREGLSLTGDARAMFSLETERDVLYGLWPVRVGVNWRF